MCDDSILVNLSTFQNFAHQIVLYSDNKIGIGVMKMFIELIKLHRTFVHQIVSDRLWDLTHDLRIMKPTLSKMDKGRGRDPEIHQHMHFERTITMMESGSWAEFETQFNEAVLKGINNFVKINANLLVDTKVLCSTNQLSKPPIYITIFFLIPFFKRRLGYCLVSRFVKVFSEEIKYGFNISHTKTVSKLSKVNHPKLVTVIEFKGTYMLPL